MENAHPDVRHLRGNWTDTVRYLQDQWDRIRPRGDPLFWDEIAQDRARGKLLLQDLLQDQGFRDGQWYPALDAIDLCGRQLLVTHTSYQLFPARHFFLEDLFETSFKVVPQVDAYDVQGGWLFACDGSSQNDEGRYAVVIIPPREAHEALIIPRGMVPSPCTNNKAEIQALTMCLAMVASLLARHPLAEVVVLTDSLFCIQLLHGCYRTVHNLVSVCSLMQAWRTVKDMVQLKHVKGHSGECHNNLADFHANQGRVRKLQQFETFDMYDPQPLIIGSAWNLKL